MRKVIFYIGIAGLIIGTILSFGATGIERYFRLDYSFRISDTDLMIYGILTILALGLVTFIAKIFISQRG